MNELGLAALPALAFGFMLVIARVGSAMLTGPGFGENDIAPPIRLGLSILFGILVYPAVESHLPDIPASFGELARLLGLEIVVGAWMGLITRMMVTALQMAGAVLSLTVGLSSVLQIDPGTGTQMSGMERMMSMAAIALFFASNLYLYPLDAIIGSYDIIRPGIGFESGDMLQLVVRAASASFSLAIRLSAPFIILSIAWQASIGLLSRLVPNIQVQIVSAPAQILGGMALFAAAITTIFSSWGTDLIQQFSRLPGL
jgi:flagellar biosynthetic protein FliR